jgi:hypothetical protein
MRPGRGPATLFKQRTRDRCRRPCALRLRLATPGEQHALRTRLTFQTLVDIHRRHFSDRPDANLEVWLGDEPSRSTSVSIGGVWLDQHTRPGQAICRAENVALLRISQDSMDSVDPEGLALRRFERLGNHQVAEVPGLSGTAAGDWYVGAMNRPAEMLQIRAEVEVVIRRSRAAIGALETTLERLEKFSKHNAARLPPRWVRRFRQTRAAIEAERSLGPAVDLGAALWSPGPQRGATGAAP